MKKWIWILFTAFLLSFIVFFSIVYYSHYQEKKQEAYLKQVEAIKTKLEQEKLAQIKKIKEEEIKQKDLEKQKKAMIEKMVANQLADLDSFQQETHSKVPLQVYQRIYLSSMQKNKIFSAIKAIKYILKYSKDKEIWLQKLVELELKVGKFSDAKANAEKLIKLNPSKENVKLYVYVLFQNTNFFDNQQVNKLRDIVNQLYLHNLISAEDLSFYNFLIDLFTKWDVKNIKKTIPLLLTDLKNPQYKNLLESIQKDIVTYENSKGSPLYYFKALVALDLLKFGYFGLAKSIAEQVYIQDSTYILPQQILAYSYFFMGNYKDALKYFLALKNNDVANSDLYNFFIGVSYYWLGDYTDALIFLSKLNYSQAEYLDALRYMLLSYIKIQDNDNFFITLQKMLGFKLNYVDYYNIFKYIFQTCKDCYKNNLKLLIKLVEKCYKDVDTNHQYVCWYGKGNLFLKYNRTALAVKYFKLLINYFQDPYLFDTIAKYYEEKKQYKLARLYYLKELLYTSNPKKREYLKQKIKKLFLNSQKK